MEADLGCSALYIGFEVLCVCSGTLVLICLRWILKAASTASSGTLFPRHFPFTSSALNFITAGRKSALTRPRRQSRVFAQWATELLMFRLPGRSLASFGPRGCLGSPTGTGL